MEHRSPKIPIILGVLLVTIVLGAIGLQLYNKFQTTIIEDDEQIVSQATTTPQLSIQDENSGWPTHTDIVLGYSIQYEPGMIVEKNAIYPNAPYSKTKATVIHFATSTLASTTFKDASVSIAKTKTECVVWADGSTKIPIQSTKIINGVSFDYREREDVRAGNFFSIQEYSVVKNNECYRISLATSLVDSNDVDSEEKVIFNAMMNSFRFIGE